VVRQFAKVATVKLTCQTTGCFTDVIVGICVYSAFDYLHLTILVSGDILALILKKGNSNIFCSASYVTSSFGKPLLHTCKQVVKN